MPILLLDLLIVAFVLFGAVGFGSLIVRLAKLNPVYLTEKFVLSAGFGMASIVIVMMILGFAGLYGRIEAWALVSVMGGAGVGAWLMGGRTGGGWGVKWGRRVPQGPMVLLIVVFAFYFLGYLAVALAPTLEGDSIAGYLLTAREYAVHGRIFSVDYAYTNTLPANGQMLSTLGFLLHGQTTAQLLVTWVPGLLGVAAIYAIGRAWLSRTAAVIGVVVWYGMYSVGYLATSGKIDLAWAAFDLLSILAFGRWYFAESSQRSWKWLVVAGLFLGVAAGTKQASVFTAVTFGAAIVFRLWSDRAINLKNVVQNGTALGIPALIAIVWVVRSYILTGSPAFTGDGLPGETGFVGFFKTIWDMSMLGNSPGTEGNFGKSIGPMVLATAPLLCVVRRVDKAVLHTLVFCFLVIIMWYVFVQRARHLLPVLGLMSLVGGYVISTLLQYKPIFGRAAIAFIAVALALNFSVWGYINFVGIQTLPYLVGLDTRAEYLQRNLDELDWYPNFTIVSAVTSLPDDAKLAGLSTTNSFYLERPVYIRAQTPEEISDPIVFLQQLKAERITHVFISDFVVKERKYDSAWLAQPMFKTRYLRELICAQGQCLYELIFDEGTVKGGVPIIHSAHG